MSISRIHRLLRLITLLQAGRSLNVEELSQELEVSRRTVFRDLNMLELAHIPYYFDRDRGGYRINNHYFLPPVNLTLGEALAVMLQTGTTRQGPRLPWAGESARAALKIQSALPQAVREYLGTVLPTVQVRPAPMARHDGLEPILDELMAAIARRRVCRIEYESFHEQQRLTLRVHPLRLVFVHRAWYLLAWSVEHADRRTLKTGRIGRLEMLADTFEPPEPTDVENPFGLAWCMIPEGQVHEVHLHFDAMVARNVAEVQWHPTQRVSFREDGSADFRAQVDGLGEIGWWVLGYGDRVKVLAPDALAERIAEVARRMVEQYDGQCEEA